MIFLAILIILIGIFEIKSMIKRKQKKEIAVFCFIAVLTIVLGYFYFKNPYQDSLGKYILYFISKIFMIEE